MRYALIPTYANSVPRIIIRAFIEAPAVLTDNTTTKPNVPVLTAELIAKHARVCPCAMAATLATTSLFRPIVAPSAPITTPNPKLVRIVELIA